MSDMSDQISEEITYDDFMKVDLRVGKVVEAERVPKSTKLIRMQVDFGSFKRQILAGVGETFEVTDLISKQFTFVVNLAPRKMMGFESHGMMLATGEDSKHLSLVSPDKEIENGLRAH